MKSVSEMMRHASPEGSQFAATMLPMLEAARAGDALALEELAGRYWYPAYAYLRGLGNERERAKDLVQEFTALILTPERLAAFDPARGRFRSFFLTGLRGFARERWRAELAQRRGGGNLPLSLDATDEEGRPLLELPGEADAVRDYESQWARTILAEARQTLRAEWSRRSKSAVFDALAPTLEGETTEEGYATLAQRLGTTVPMLKKTAFQLRAEFRQRQVEVLRREFGRPSTSASDDAVLAELKDALRPQ
ncbi:MAG TPA: hypothetical protein VMB21_18165 [Candidatus Limnocylindria bacterium]|nr:hypothetical protein [Candidatus Limnocylindria bacterium]